MGEAIDTLKKIFNVEETKIKIINIRKSPLGIFITFDPSEDIEKITTSLTECDDFNNMFTLQATKKEPPRLIIFDVPSTLTKEDITKKLEHQNDLPPGAISPDFPLRTTRGSGTNWVATVSPSVFTNICDKEGLYIDYQRHRTKEFISIRVCHLCGRLGHTKKVCHNTVDYCLECTEPLGDSGDATSGETSTHICKVVKCINCKFSNVNFRTKHDTKHVYRSKNCPNYLRQVNLVRSRIDYG